MIILFGVISVVVVLIDQITKMMVIGGIDAAEKITVIPNVLSFVYVKNTGAAFSIFSSNTAFLSIVSALFCIAVLVYVIAKKPKDKLLNVSLALLFSGALGNAIDRIARRYVVDFFETEFVRFPVFNVADIAITVGTVLFIIYVLVSDKKDEDKNSGEN